MHDHTYIDPDGVDWTQGDNFTKLQFSICIIIACMQL